MHNRVFLIKDYQIAQSFAQHLKETGVAFATVEAEYGDFCVEGTHATLAHHVSIYRDFPAPCVRTDVSPLKDGVILISHLDLDTLGGIAILEDRYTSHSFWASEAIIDTKGALGLPLIPSSDNELMEIFWAWENTCATLKPTSDFKILDVTTIVEERLSFLSQLLNDQLPYEDKTSYLKLFHDHLSDYLESCVYEDEQFKIFVNESPMHFKVHKQENKMIPICIHYNPKRGSIIVSDISGRIDCGALMKECFGPKAGGQFRIGGTPRDQFFSLFATLYLKTLIESRFSQ